MHLTSSKVKTLYKLLDLILCLHTNRNEVYSAKEHNTKLNSFRDGKKFRTALKDVSTDWFIVAVHTMDEDLDRSYNCTGSVNRFNELLTRVYGPKNMKILTNWEGYPSELEVISPFAELDSELFQLNTVYDNKIIAALICEEYLRNKLDGSQYVAINIDKILNMDEEYIERIVDSYNHYVKPNSGGDTIFNAIFKKNNS